MATIDVLTWMFVISEIDRRFNIDLRAEQEEEAMIRHLLTGLGIRKEKNRKTSFYLKHRKAARNMEIRQKKEQL